MAAATTRQTVWKRSAAAEHGQPAAAQHGTNIAFANMDWKSSRHTGNKWARHAEIWQMTTKEIIRGFDPAVICFCEVGDVSNPLKQEYFDDLKDLTRGAWTSCGAAAEHVEFLQTPHKPYLTAYRTDRVRCSHYRILSDLYPAQGSERTAQHFLVTPAGTSAAESSNIINVHAPSGTKKLSDNQRKTLVTKLLQSTSLNDTTKSVGNDRSIIGGDFNTGELALAQIMRPLLEGISTQERLRWKAFRQVHGYHGDMGFCLGVQGHMLNTYVGGHDPKHFPYAFRWEHGLAPALQQTLPPAAAEHWARPATAEDFAPQPTPAEHGAAQDDIAHLERQATQRQHTELPDTRLAAEAMTQPVHAPTPRPAPAEQVATRPAQTPSQRCPHGGATTLQQALPPAAAEHSVRAATAEDVATPPTPAEHGATHENIAHLQRQTAQRQHAELLGTRLAAEAMTQPANAPTSRIAPAEQVATTPAQEPSQRCTHGGPTTLQEAVPPAAAEHWARASTAEDIATQPTPAEHWTAQVDIAHLERRATQRQHAELPERIVHAFLDDVPITDDQSARRVTEILEDETKLSDDALRAIAEVFECAFIWYTDKNQRTEFVHCDTLGYVRVWQKLALFRRAVGQTEYFDGTQLSPERRQTVFQAYLEDFNSTELRPEQKPSRKKSYAEARLRKIAANRIIPFVIWEVGVPRIATAAEQRDTHAREGAPAAEQRADALEANTIAILEWLDGAARSIIEYKNTAAYKESVRVAGPRRGVPGLTAEELAHRADLRRAKFNVRKGRRLAELWDQRRINFDTISPSDWAVLQNHWSAIDVQHVREIQEQGSDRNFTMPSLWKN